MRFFLILFFIPLMMLGQSGSTSSLSTDIDFAQAESLFKKEAYTQAKPIFEQYLKENPKDTRTLEYLGDIAGYAKDWDTAIEYYKQLVKLEPKNANFHYKYGGVLGMKALDINRLRALSLLGDIKEAFLTAAALDPNHIILHWFI